MQIFVSLRNYPESKMNVGWLSDLLATNIGNHIGQLTFVAIFAGINPLTKVRESATLLLDDCISKCDILLVKFPFYKALLISIIPHQEL